MADLGAARVTPALFVSLALSASACANRAQTNDPDAEDARDGGTAIDAADSADAGTALDDSFLFCPHACEIALCQQECQPAPAQVEHAQGGEVQFRGALEIGSMPGQTSATICGTLMEAYNCGACWGIGEMDTFWPRISAVAVNTTDGAGELVHRLRVRYSWNGVDANGRPLDEYSLFTAIVSRVEITVRDGQTGTVLVTKTQVLGEPGGLFLNFGGFGGGCDGDGISFADVILDVPVPAGPQARRIEVVSIGNYE